MEQLYRKLDHYTNSLHAEMVCTLSLIYQRGN